MTACTHSRHANPRHRASIENHALKLPVKTLSNLRHSPLIAALLAALAPLATPTAMAADVAPPNAGTLLQQVAPPTTPTPASRPTGLTIDKQGGSALPDSAPFEVKALQISGNTRFDSATLLALVAEAEGRRLTLAQLDALISRITEFYRRAGYPLARAILPAQTISAGVVRIEVIEARFGSIRLDNRSAVSSRLLNDTLAAMRSGEVITQGALDRSLLLAGDLPGLTLGAVLQPGQAVGSSDLLVNVGPGPVLSGDVVVDDHGNRFTGRTHLGAGLNWLNPLHQGDVLSANLLSSGAGLNYGRLAYETQLNGQGTRAAGAYSALRYTLGDSAAALQAHGTAKVASLWLSHPLIRGVDHNQRGQLQFDGLDLRDHVDASAIQSDRHVKLLTLSLAGDAIGKLLPGGANAWNLGLSAGWLNFDNAAAASADASTTRAQGSFSRLNLQLAHNQALTASTSLALNLSGQRAQGNLDPSQKLSLGGPHNVRAYDSGALSGDSGYTLSVELRQVLTAANPAWGQWQAVVFADSGHVTINQQPWQAGVNSATLSGLGLGLNWAGPDLWSARASVAAPVGSKTELSGVNRATRGWIELLRGF